MATGAQQRQALRTAFAPGTPIPDQFIADLRATGRRNLLAASGSIDTYLATAPLAERLIASGTPAELVYGDRDARTARPPSTTLTHTLLTRTGHTPPWEDPARVGELIIASVHDSGTGVPVTSRARRVSHG
jgi:pimeloyl-ACP methyl ester carboxylesterase